MAEHWRTLIDVAPFLSLSAGGQIRPDWRGIMNTAITGVIAGAMAGYITIVRIEERVAQMERRLTACEETQTRHEAEGNERWAHVRERLAACETSRMRGLNGR
jgi:hypothetical protein